MLMLIAALAAASTAPIRVATYTYPAYDRKQALAPVAQLIAETTGRPVEVLLVSSPDELASALRDHRVDVAMTNLSSFIDASRDEAIKPIAMLSVPAATLEGYRGVLLARRGRGIGNLSDLARAGSRLRYAEVLPGSTSGAMVQAEALRLASLERRRFASLQYAGTHQAAIERLLSDQSDVAALADGAWRELQKKQPAQAATLVELWRSAPIPPGPIVCVHAPSVPCAKIAKRLLTGDGRVRAAAAELAQGWSETAGATNFTAVEKQVYKAFIKRP